MTMYCHEHYIICIRHGTDSKHPVLIVRCSFTDDRKIKEAEKRLPCPANQYLPPEERMPLTYSTRYSNSASDGSNHGNGKLANLCNGLGTLPGDPFGHTSTEPSAPPIAYEDVPTCPHLASVCTSPGNPQCSNHGNGNAPPPPLSPCPCVDATRSPTTLSFKLCRV